MDRPQRLARKSEHLTAQRHGGRVTPASGSGGTVKNDVRNDDWSFEVKSTQQKSYSLRRDTLAQAVGNALADGRRMALVLDFVSLPGTYPRFNPGRYVVMTEDDFLEREEHIKQLAEDAWAYNDLRDS